MRLLRCWIGVSGQEGKTANDKDQYKDKKTITKTKTKTQKKTRIVMKDNYARLQEGDLGKRRAGSSIREPFTFTPLYSVNQCNDVLHQSTRFYSEFTLQRSVLVHYLSDMYT